MNRVRSSLKGLNRSGLAHLLVVYIVWSSTYLAIRLGVREGSGFTPFVFGAMRVLTAGGILLLWSRLTGKRLRLTRNELFTTAGSGLLLWLCGNGLVTVAEQRADSGLAALIVASTPIWVAMMEGILNRRLPTRLLVISLLAGTAGIVVLSMPLLLSGVHADFLSWLALIAASITWSAGSLLQSRNKVGLAPTVSSGYQLLFGGIGFSVVALILGEPLPHPSLEAWMAWGYLVLFGSVVAFTSYVQALRLLPARVATTYAYVNPILAVVLGWLVLREEITLWTVGGAVLVLIGVAGVFRSHKHEQETQREISTGAAPEPQPGPD
jgi:drug/metabolite transporter (DMT)-like permease